MSIQKADFGQTKDGRDVVEYTLKNENNVSMKVINFGAIVTSIRVPDRDGNMGDIALGCDTLQGYLDAGCYLGAVVGRYGNRIAKGKFTLNDQTCTLAINNDQNHLHGGLVGFDKVIWDVTEINKDNAAGLRLTYVSKDGEEGYPGTLRITLTYLLTNNDEFLIKYKATTDKDTVVNLTQHTYFNLTGEGERDILDHVMMINADRFTPVDAALIPTGELAPVEGTPLDFRKPTVIGERIDNVDDEQIRRGGGYDHNWVLNRSDETSMVLAARVKDPGNGRVLSVYTREPGMQFYSGNFLDGTVTGKAGKAYKHRYGFCLETQHYPDSPNQPNFPTTVLKAGDTYETATTYNFTVE